MIPLVSPAPLSAWMLPGLICAYPQPAAISCCVAGGSCGAAGAAGGAEGGALAPAARPAPAGAPNARPAPAPAAAAPAGGGPPARGAPAPARPPRAGCAPPGIVVPPPNIIITGTGPFASAGVTSVIWMSTVIAGYDELSTCPTSTFPTTGRSPT